MKILKYISAFAVLALLGLSSCTTDVLTSNNSASQGKGRKVSLTLGSTAKTRSANLGGFDREKAIDGTKLYAVVFDQQGKFVETIAIADYDSSDGSCSFTLSDAGVYYGYIIANTSKGTDLSGLTAGTSTEDDLFNIIEDTDPGADLASSTNFLMTSKRTLLDVDGDADTSLGTITLTRAVVRIDIDATAITGLAITKVEVQSRYKKSLIIRGNNPDDATLTAATPTDTKTYTRGTNAGEVPALDGTSTGQNHALVTDREWQGVIYGYENIDPATTVVKITHTLNGVASTTTVNFSDANSGAGQALKRNNIYTVKLSDGAPSPTLQDITATITVTDWDTSTNLSYTALTDHAKPDFEVTSSHTARGFSSGTLNPTTVLPKRTDTPTEITLQVTSQGKVASGVSFVNKNGSAYDFLGDAVGGAIEQVGATTYVDGTIVQNFKITIPQDIVIELSGTDYLTFKVHNVFDDTSTGSREFTVCGSYGGIAVGDIIYHDGSWSHGSTEMATQLSAGKTPVAIVFATSSTVTMDQYDIDHGFTNGYAMSLKDANDVNSMVKWASDDYKEVVVNTLHGEATQANGRITYLENLFSGFKDTKDVIDYCTTNAVDYATNFPAFYVATSYKTRVDEDLSGTSGWYLPSFGQWYQVFKVFAGISDTNLNYRGSSGSVYKDVYWNGTSFTTYMVTATSDYLSNTGLPADMYEDLSRTTHANLNNTNTTLNDSWYAFWTSTASDYRCRYNVFFYAGQDYFFFDLGGYASRENFIRPFLSF